MVNFNIDKATDNDIEKQRRTKGIATFWRDQNEDNVYRLYQSSWQKASVYQDLIAELQVPYVVSVFGEFRVAIELSEVCRCLYGSQDGLFEKYPRMSGVLYFVEDAGKYQFSYLKNERALWSIDVPGAVFPSSAT